MAKKTFLLSYSMAAGNFQKIRDFLDQHHRIQHWMTCLPFTFFVVTDMTATELSAEIRALSKGKGRFLVLDTAGVRQGWLPKSVWEMMKNPEGAGKPPKDK